MNTLLGYIERELPEIDRFLSQQTERLSPLVRPVVSHVLTAGGKRFRPILTILCARALGHAGDDVYPLACSLELLHSATLLHDDIVDGAALRRGKASAHMVYSRTETILAGDVLLALANRLVADYGIPSMVSCLSEAILRTAEGEVGEIAGMRSPSMSLERYLEIITGKTAYLLEASCQSGAILARAPREQEEAAAAFGLNLGIAFQIVDDVLDYTSPSTVSGKPAGGDLREGKMTLPLILYLEGKPEGERAQFLERLCRRDFTDEEIADVVAQVQQGGHTQASRERARAYVQQGHKALEAFPACIEREILTQTLEFVLTRDK